MDNIRIFRCFIASPGDTSEERDLCDKVIEDINTSMGSYFGFRLETVKWENNVHPAIGTDGQDVINEQLGLNYDIFIGIMYMRFGTPTPRAGSGTEEEFNRAVSLHQANNYVEIMFYFNNKASNISDIDATQLFEVKAFKEKVRNAGCLYWDYDGQEEFANYLRKHLIQYLSRMYGPHSETEKSIRIATLLEERFNKSLKMYEDQPNIWIEPVLYEGDLSMDPDEAYDNKIPIDSLIDNPQSYNVIAPPLFGLSSLSHYLVLKAWKAGAIWARVDISAIKLRHVNKAIQNYLGELGGDFKISNVQCIVLDQFKENDKEALKKLKAFTEEYKSIPIIVMRTKDDVQIMKEEPELISIDRSFKTLHLVAMTRHQIRDLVSQYNKDNRFEDEDILVSKLVSDLEVLNIHRTAYNCLTLLKVDEHHFDETPVNRTRMLDMVLMVLFDYGKVPQYRSKPDVKDCEHVLGYFCEKLMRDKDRYFIFSKEYLKETINDYCEKQFIDLDTEALFDILCSNSIIVSDEQGFKFRSAFWVFYFTAKRMHTDKTFAGFIFKEKLYLDYPEIIEFYTGIDRNRTDALEIMINDISTTCTSVYDKIGIPDSINPYAGAKWHPSDEYLLKMEEELGENIMASKLPNDIKDRYADREYNALKPYNQSVVIHDFLETYSVYNLMQSIKSSSRALRNSDYASPEKKIQLLDEVLRSWLQISKVLFALTPMLASEGSAGYGGASFVLKGDFGETYQDRLRTILFCSPINVVGFFREDIYSEKIAPLLYKRFSTEANPILRHEIALLIITSRPKNWHSEIDKYITGLPKDSFFLYDTVNALRAQYRYAFVDENQLRKIALLIKKGLAKHHLNVNNPGSAQIRQISNDALPKREEEDV